MNEQLTLPKMRRRKHTPSGDELKRKGTEQALQNERARWRRRALECVIGVARSKTFFTADDIQRRAELAGLGPPHHPNVWGAVIRAALLMGVMTKTGRYVKGSRAAQHSRMIPEYRRVDAD